MPPERVSSPSWWRTPTSVPTRVERHGRTLLVGSVEPRGRMRSSIPSDELCWNDPAASWASRRSMLVRLHCHSKAMGLVGCLGIRHNNGRPIQAVQMLLLLHPASNRSNSPEPPAIEEASIQRRCARWQVEGFRFLACSPSQSCCVEVFVSVGFVRESRIPIVAGADPCLRRPRSDASNTSCVVLHELLHRSLSTHRLFHAFVWFLRGTIPRDVPHGPLATLGSQFLARGGRFHDVSMPCTVPTLFPST